MRRLALVLLFLAAPAPAGAAKLLVVGQGGKTLLGPRAAGLKGERVAGCRVAGRTALAALARTRLKLSVTDYGSCGSGLYVASIAGQRERGVDGWVYKLGNRAPSVGAGDRSGRFGRRARVLWFWCNSGANGCQRTLSVKARRKGDRIRVRVRAHDNTGAAIPAAGATVRAGRFTAETGRNGVALLPGSARRVVATKPGAVRSFPARVK